MKKLLLICFSFFVVTSATKAQIDVQVNPIGLLFSSFNIPIEYGVSDNKGVELDLLYNFNKFTVGSEEWKNSGIGANLIGKYYFSPNRGLDKWNLGPYLSFSSGTQSTSVYETDTKHTRFSLGLYGGYKYVSAGNFIFEIGMGLGRALVNEYKNDDESISLTDFPLLNIDFIGKLSIGYRFGEAGGGSSNRRRR